MNVAIEVAEIALAVVTSQVDLVPIILAETYRPLDRSLHRCGHFNGCAFLVQVKKCHCCCYSTILLYALNG